MIMRLFAAVNFNSDTRITTLNVDAIVNGDVLRVRRNAGRLGREDSSGL
jgi:hypothetical protein